jgi:hypothetical protein
MVFVACLWAMALAPIGGAAHAAAPPPSPSANAALRMGEWDHLQLGFFTPRPEDQAVTKTYLGLRHTETWFDLFLRDASGKFFFVSNVVHHGPDGRLTAGPWVPLLRAGPKGLAPDARQPLWSGDAAQALTADGRNRYTVHDGQTDQQISFDEKTLDWRSGDAATALKGSMTAPAIQFLLPWREPGGATNMMQYTAQYYEVSGTYDGQPVTGYALIEHTWAKDNYLDTFWVQNRQEYAAFWYTTYDDGTTDSGYLFCGNYGARGAIMANSKTGQILNTFDLSVDRSKAGRAVFTFPGAPPWEFIVDPSSAGAPVANADFTIGFGVVKRVGERRRIVRNAALFFLRGDKCGRGGTSQISH